MSELLLGPCSRICGARPDDAPTLYALAVEAFGDAYLPYTVYQAPESVRYLRQLISQGSQNAGHSVRVLAREGRIEGFYHAVQGRCRFFLNYIVVAAEARGHGWGRALLGDYEDRGRSLGCAELVLDVFETNGWVASWYKRRGFQLGSASFHVRLALDSIGGASVPVSYDDVSRDQAREEERYLGFSKVVCRCGSGDLTVGLIAQHTCKLITYKNTTLREAVLGIGSAFRREREVLILPGLPTMELEWPALSSERVLRLRKAVG